MIRAALLLLTFLALLALAYALGFESGVDEERRERDRLRLEVRE